MALENLELRSKVITDLINEFLEKGQVEVADKLKAISDLDYMKEAVNFFQSFAQ